MIITKTKSKQVVGGKTIVITTTKTVKLVKDYISEAADSVEKKANELISSAMNNPEVKKVIGAASQSMKVIMEIMRTYRKIEQTMEAISFIIKDISLLAGAWTNPTTIPVALNDFIKIAQAYTSRMPMQLLKLSLEFILKLPVSETTSSEAKEIIDALNKTTNAQKTLSETKSKEAIENITIDEISGDITTTGTLETPALVTGWKIVEEADKRLKLLKVRKYFFSIYGEGGVLDNTNLGDGIVDVAKIFLTAVNTYTDLPAGVANNYTFVLDEKRYYRYYNNEYFIDATNTAKLKQLQDELIKKIAKLVKASILLERPDFQGTMDKLGLATVDLSTYNQLLQLDLDSIKSVNDYVDSYSDYLIKNILTDEELTDLINKIIKDFEKNYSNNAGKLRVLIDSALSNKLREAMKNFLDVDVNYYIEALRLFTENLTSILSVIDVDFEELSINSDSFSNTNIVNATTTAKTKYDTYIDLLKTEYTNGFAAIAASYTEFDSVKEKTLDLFSDLILLEKSDLRKLSSTNFYLTSGEFDSLKTSFDIIFDSNKVKVRNEVSNIIKRIDVDINDLNYNKQIYEEKRLKVAFNSIFDDFKLKIIKSLNELMDTDILFESYSKRYRIFTRVLYFINYVVQIKLASSINNLEASLETFYTAAAGDSNAFKASVLAHLESVWKSIHFSKTIEYARFEFDEQAKSILLGLTNYYSKTTS